MTAAQLLAALRSKAVLLGVNEGRLSYDAPHGVMTPALREQLRALKAGVINLILHERIDWQLARLRPVGGNPRALVSPVTDVGMLELVTWVLNRKPPPPRPDPAPPPAPRRDCLEAARATGWEAVDLRPGERVIAGAPAWERFAAHASAPDVVVALCKLRVMSRKRAAAA